MSTSSAAGTEPIPAFLRYERTASLSSHLPFDYLAHLVTVPVRVGANEVRFVLDSGIGLTLVSESLARRVRCEPTDSSFAGKRMSGQEISLPISRLPALAVGDHRKESFPVGVLDMGQMAGLDGVDGFLSLKFFTDLPFTVDYSTRSVVIEDDASLAAREREGAAVDVEVESCPASVCVYLPMELPDGNRISAEVDMGSDSLILDCRLAAGLGVDLEAPAVRKVEGTDETGNKFVRYFTSLVGTLRAAEAPAVSQDDPDVMFQDIIHDGLVGDAFLRRQPLTFDLPGERLIFGRRSSEA